jgi:hypothetical protein
LITFNNAALRLLETNQKAPKCTYSMAYIQSVSFDRDELKEIPWESDAPTGYTQQQQQRNDERETSSFISYRRFFLNKNVSSRLEYIIDSADAPRIISHFSPATC